VKGGGGTLYHGAENKGVAALGGELLEENLFSGREEEVSLQGKDPSKKFHYGKKSVAGKQVCPVKEGGKKKGR